MGRGVGWTSPRFFSQITCVISGPLPRNCQSHYPRTINFTHAMFKTCSENAVSTLAPINITHAMFKTCSENVVSTLALINFTHAICRTHSLKILSRCHSRSSCDVMYAAFGRTTLLSVVYFCIQCKFISVHHGCLDSRQQR